MHPHHFKTTIINIFSVFSDRIIELLLTLTPWLNEPSQILQLNNFHNASVHLKQIVAKSLQAIKN